MELQEFVKETLLQITKGVKDAQEAVKEYGAVVNPKQYKSTSDTTNAKVKNEYYPVQNINFEVAVARITDGLIVLLLITLSSPTGMHNNVSRTEILFSTFASVIYLMYF